MGRDLRASDEGGHLGGAFRLRAERLPAERNTFELAKLLTEMMIVKTNIAGAGEMQDTVPHTRRKAARARPTATGVCQDGSSLLFSAYTLN